VHCPYITECIQVFGDEYHAIVGTHYCTKSWFDRPLTAKEIVGFKKINKDK
jgi:hypothetical protein